MCMISKKFLFPKNIKFYERIKLMILKNSLFPKSIKVYKRIGHRPISSKQNHLILKRTKEQNAK